jgi:hypothetical protein
VLAALESGQDLGDVLEETAAGSGGPMAGLGVFGWLADRFGIGTPRMVADASATPSSEESTRAVLAGFVSEVELTSKIRSQLRVTLYKKVLEAASDYEATLFLLLDVMTERAASGVSHSTSLELLKGSTMDASIEKQRATSRLLMAVDSHEDTFGYRIGPPTEFPADWANRHEQTLEEELHFFDQSQQPLARRLWRSIEMERATVVMYRIRLQHLDSVRRGYTDQFNIGQRSIEDIVGISRVYYDIETQMISNQYRLYDVQAQLLGEMGRLFSGDLSSAVES